ncbi:hypothetical protein KIPB_010122 [Kipferlia bialata]|uniref:Uncharacterized protein n=1 Tax=Kipferlia bialata TaxID=797122 RepID=A0A9K3D2Q9_9EUKA|nr:hypothetical protein KIPB_010122 [Kipferlia bialata]|eukprot:g10122.t1
MVTVDPQGDSVPQKGSSDISTQCNVSEVTEVPHITIQVPADMSEAAFQHLQELKYTGGLTETANGMRPRGKGVMTLKGGRVFTGVWEGDLLDGYGTVTFPDGAGVYQGEWRACLLWGHGTLTYKDGGCYTGEWEEGMMNGEGTMEYNTGEVYTGEWQNCHRHGHGTNEYANGGINTGYWERDQQQGYGTMKYISGDLCEGEWRDGTECHGTLTTEDGDVSEGHFHRGVLEDGVVRPVNGPEYTVGKGRGASCPQAVSLASATPQPLKDETIESIAQQYSNLHFGDTLGDLRAEYGPATLAPLHTLDSVYEDEESTRALYTRLAETVHTQYVLKLPKEGQGALWERGDTLQCIPLNRYFEEVWGTQGEG